MNWAQTVNTLIFVFGTFAAVLEGIYLSKIWAQKLPEHTRLALEQFAHMAVCQVEQQSRTLSGAAKKQLAITAVTKFFQFFSLPVPPVEAIDMAIEAAVLMLPTKSNTAVESDSPVKIESPKPNV